jgi:hypothetical protein
VTGWPEHTNQGDPFGEVPVEPFDIGLWAVEEFHRDPTIDQPTAYERAWLRVAAEILTNRNRKAA